MKHAYSRQVIPVVVVGLSLFLAACGGNTQPAAQQNATAPGNAGGTAVSAFDHSALDGLLTTFVNDEGWVDYAGLQRERAKLDAYLTTLGAAAPQSFGNDSERLAFWINAYSAFTLADALDDGYQKAKGVKEVSGCFDKKRHRVAGADLKLDEIEKRGRDLKDARTHFAVVCAATSCPKLQRFAYTGVALDEQLTRISREFLNDPARGYVIAQLPPGAYQLVVESQGFKRFVRDGVVLQVGQRVRVNVQLEVGEVTESVRVTAQTPLLESSDASLGQAIENRKILDLPLNGRNILALAALTTGVNPGKNFGIGSPDGRAAAVQAASSNIQINGGIAAHNDVLLDGVPLSVCCQNQIAFIPSIDTTQEFRVRTSMYDAQFGRTSGGIVSYATRSGTNNYHGTLYEFHRNQALDANNFFSNRAGLGKSHFVYNQFGGAFGGRLLRDRTFFFGNYEGIRNRRGSFLTGRVPTAEERQGIFKEAIFDPLTMRREGNVFIRTPFANNTIPQNRIDPVAAKLLQLYPLSNTVGTNNFISNASSADTENQFTVRLDHQLTKTQRLFVRFSFNASDSIPPDWFGNIASPGIFSQEIDNRNFVIDDVMTLPRNWVVNVRYGLTRQNNVRAPRSEGTDLTQFGWPASFSNARQAATLAKINPAGSLGLSSNALFHRVGEVHAFGADATKVRGQHTVRFGADLRLYRTNWFDNNDAAGNFNFNVGFTRGPNAQTGGGGNSFASFLLGYPASGNITILESFASGQIYSGLYFQDDWRVSNKLTLNLGLRWDVETARDERFDRLSWFDPEAPSPLAAQVGQPNLKGGLRFLNVGDDIGRQQATDWNNFGPRVGLAWTPFSRLVVRAGYGITFLPITSRYVNSSNQGFLATTSFFASTDGLTPVGKLSDPFPSGVLRPAGSANGLLTNLGENLGTLLYEAPVGYSQQWSLNLQYELARDLLVDAAYVGSKGTKLPAPLALNQLNDALLAQGNALLQTVANPFRPFVSSGTLSGTNVTRLQLLRPFPQFLGVTDNVASLGSSGYHAFQLKVNKRLSAGFSVLVAYTNAKLISDTPAFLVSFLDAAPGFQNVYNRRADRAIDPQDISQRLAISYIWELPFGKGQRWLNGAPFAVDALLGGWQVNGITTFQTGQPIVVGLATPTTSGATRPHLIGDPKKSGSAVDGLLVPVAASTTHVAFSSIRLEPTWMALGQAAGTAAHFAIKLKKQPRDLPVEMMQRELLKRGQALTYFKDLDTKAPSFAATQYFGAKGFFKDYNLRAREPVTRAQAASWLNLALKITGAEIKVGGKWAARWRDLSDDAPHFNDAAALAIAQVIESPLEKPAFEPSQALTRAEFEHWLYRFGHLLNRWPRASEAPSPEKTLRERGLGREAWTDPANSATRAQDPILRGEFCRALYDLLEQTGH